MAMLACARIGAIHSVVFGGFQLDLLEDRIADGDCCAVITADGGWRRGSILPLKPAVDEAVANQPGVKTVLCVRRTEQDVAWDPDRDVWLHEALEGVSDECAPEPMDAEDVLFLLYTSGSTGKPKGIVHTTGGYLVGAYLSTQTVFDLREDDVYWCTADVGWITGHSYIVYGPLANGATMVMYEGAPNAPHEGRFWEWCENPRRDDLLHRADRHPRVHEVGRRARREARPLEASACSARWGSRSTRRLGSGTARRSAAAAARSSTRGGRRRPVRSCSRRYRGRGEAGLRDAPVLRRRRRDPRRGGQRGPEGQRRGRAPRDPSPLAEHAPRDLGRRAALPRHLLVPLARCGRYSTWQGTARAATRTAISGSSGAWTTCSTSPGIASPPWRWRAPWSVTIGVVEAAVVARPDDLTGERDRRLRHPWRGRGRRRRGARRPAEGARGGEIGKLARPAEVRVTPRLPKTRSGKIMRRLLRAIASGEEITAGHHDARGPHDPRRAARRRKADGSKDDTHRRSAAAGGAALGAIALPLGGSATCGRPPSGTRCSRRPIS